jgi:hypothetical protein
MTQTSYRIGFLNPWKDKAENQAFQSLQEAARRIGHEYVHVTTSDEILAANLDFVMAVASTQPKLTPVPTFGAIHEPRTRFWEKPEYFDNLLTYDGYLTISDSLVAFLNAFCAGAGKPQHVGAYYNTPQRQTELATDIEALAARGALGLCYFGTNWDPRTRPLFRALVQRPFMRIYGPQGSWDYLQGEKYFGSPAFDGHGPQKEYAAHGVGLAVLSRGHALDDVISNRVFEICSVGAAAICPDIPWVRKNFGDTVWYFDSNNTSFEIAEQIDAAMAQIAADPKRAAARAKAAQQIFNDRFAGEVLIANAVRYFEEWKERGGKLQPPSDSPLIDVIVRVGSRPASTVLRAIRSLEDQTAGRFRVLFVRFRPMDLTQITEARWERIESFKVFDCPGGNRPTTLTFGLQQVEAPFFAMLDDDDFLLPEHFSALLRAAADAPQDRVYAYSGVVDVEEMTEGDDPGAEERRRIFNLKPAQGDAWTIMGAFAPHGFMAATPLLKFADLSGWTLSTGEDTLLNMILAGRGEPRFSYRATACHVIGSAHASNFNDTPTRQEDLFQAFLRDFTLLDRLERNFGKPSMSNWERLSWQLQRVLGASSRQRTAKLSVLVLEEGVLGTSIHDRDDLDLRRVPITPVTVERFAETRLQPADEGRYGLSILPDSLPWAYGAAIELDAALMFPGPQWIVAEFEAVPEAFGVGVLDRSSETFQSRTEMPISAVPVEIWLHIHDAANVSKVMVQNWANPLNGPARLKALWVVRQKLGRTAE